VAALGAVATLGTLGGTSVAVGAPSQPAAGQQQPACGGTAVRSGRRPPGWTIAARPPSGVPFALSEQGNVTAILFGSPLRSGRPIGHRNKILWIVRAPRHGRSLHVTARLLHRGSPTVRLAVAADAAPGEIYPSVVDVPTPGCWHVTLAWDGHRAALDLRYQ
jgi:hypothetical protein